MICESGGEEVGLVVTVHVAGGFGTWGWRSSGTVDVPSGVVG